MPDSDVTLEDMEYRTRPKSSRTQNLVGRYLNKFLSLFAYTFLDMDPKTIFFVPLASPHHELQESVLKSKNDFVFWELQNPKIEIIIYFSDYDLGRVRYD